MTRNESTYCERFSIHKFLGDQPSGALYLALDKKNRKRVVIYRLFSKDYKSDFQLWEKDFKVVVKKSTSLNAIENLTQVTGGDVDEDGPFFVLEPFQGSPMLRNFPAAMPVSDFLHFAEDSLRALQGIHKAGYIHSAINPESFILTIKNFKKSPQYLIADLFMNELLAHIKGLDTDIYVGAPLAIIAPEIFQGKVISYKTDIYMLGQTFYYYCAGAHPFVGLDLDECQHAHENHLIDPLETFRHLPTGVAEMIEHMTQPDPKERPSDINKLIEFIQLLRGK